MTSKSGNLRVWARVALLVIGLLNLMMAVFAGLVVLWLAWAPAAALLLFAGMGIFFIRATDQTK